MIRYEDLLKKFFHDPLDKPFDIPGHITRAREYAEILGVTGLEEANASDCIASCMERSLLPPNIIQKEFNQIRHPLSDGIIEIPHLDIRELKDIIKNALEEINSQIYNYDDKNKFIYLWRNLLQIIFEKTKTNHYSKFLQVLPADTRVPDHSIWEHLKTTCAINAFESLQNNSLFLFTIGPVQAFISQARKAQDLFSGSFILSYLTFIGITEIIDKYGPTSVIYPDLFGQPLVDWYLEKEINVKNSSSYKIEIPTIPNRFVVIIPEAEETKITELAKSITTKVKNEWNELSNNVLSSFKINKDEKMKCHLQDFPQIYWVTLPWRKGEKDITIDDLSIFIETEKSKELFEFASKKGAFKPNIGLLYQALYTSIEKSIGSRKNLRDFNRREECGKKCSICGEREGIIKAETGKLRIGRFISKEEALCGLCFVKRSCEKYFNEKFNKELSFPSTAEVALSDFKEKALKEAKEDFKEYINKFKEIAKESFQKVEPLPKLAIKFDKGIENLEGEWFFEENLTQNAIKKNLDVNIKDKELKELKEKLKAITDKVGKPNSYYAIIMVDGDNMGKWLSGKLLPSIEYAYNSEVWGKQLSIEFKEEYKKITSKKILTPAIHLSISHALKNYSLEFVKNIIEEEHLGKLIYCGGDDVLAFVNVGDLFQVMRKIRAAFSGDIEFKNGIIEVKWGNNSGFVEKDNSYVLTMGKNATSSMGVVIAYYKMPLQIVLKKLREMEREAKDLPNKDAFCIALLKHSGEERIGLSKWRYGEIDVVKCLEELSEKMIKKEVQPYLSDKFIYNLRDEFLRLSDEKGKFTVTGEIFNVEFKRLLTRAYNGHKEKKKEFLKDLYDPLKDIFWNITGGNIQNFQHLLEISAFISKEQKE